MRWKCQQPSKVLPAIVHPTKCCTQHTYNTVVQPHIHPSHTTNVNHTNIQNQHYFPHTQSAENVSTNQNFNMGPGVAGAYMPGPGPGPGSGPGSWPGQGNGSPSQGVAGAYQPGYKR
jgi:spore coat protein D